MSLSGNLKTMDLAEVLQWVTMGRKTGSLTFIRNKTKNHIYFRSGLIISSKSNEPTKQLGHFLHFQGKLSESQLKRALEIKQQMRAPLGKVLVEHGFVTPSEVEKALVSRTEEVIYDLFLWEDGYFHFTADGYNIEELILITIDLNGIIFEGVRRKDEWVRIREVFPSNDVVLALRADTDLKLVMLTPLQKKLLFLANMGKTISEIILELHGSDFLVNFELFRLYEKGVIEVREVKESTKEEQEDPARLFNQGLELMQLRRFPDAITVFQEIIRSDPQNQGAHEQIELAEKAICQDLYMNAFGSHKVPYFLVSEDLLLKHNLTPQEGFVASRINGGWDVKSIVMLSPLREFEILQIIDKLIKMKLVALR